jgi:hypothetical protein
MAKANCSLNKLIVKPIYLLLWILINHCLIGSLGFSFQLRAPSLHRLSSRFERGGIIIMSASKKGFDQEMQTVLFVECGENMNESNVDDLASVASLHVLSVKVLILGKSRHLGFGNDGHGQSATKAAGKREKQQLFDVPCLFLL